MKNIFTAFLLFTAILSLPAVAQKFGPSDFPSRPIRLIVPGPAGGPTDIMARVYADRISQELGQPIIIDNKPGGNTIIAAQQAIKSAPDGYTLFAAMQETMAINPSTFSSLPYSANRGLFADLIDGIQHIYSRRSGRWAQDSCGPDCDGKGKSRKT